MRKNMIKIGVIGMALVFALGVSFNAMAMEPVSTVTPVPTKTAVTSNVITDSATRIDMNKLPVSVQPEFKAAAIQAGKDTLIKLEKDGTLTKAQADKLAKKVDKGHGFAFGHYKNGHHKNIHYKNGHNKMMNNNGIGNKDFKGMNSGNNVNCRL